ncbi:DDB1- and CUL4-associated factor 8 isoform X2 [Tribolium madens]|uniref:DDB1- and CUL4-associated factor 8 isoform X2 n=1 Tax=Tribolium madens TaxID=41895 RepID=UPI001CF741BA|nr:DDB1- and CUL4-associated factor 8 isoform X2 [Tribolium madens]
MDDKESNKDNKTKSTSNEEDKSKENAKRFKTNDSGLGRSEESSSSNTDQETASTSTDTQNGEVYKRSGAPAVTFRTTPNSRNRNYRNSRENLDDSGDRDDDPMGEEEATPPAEEPQNDGDNDWEDHDDNDWEDHDDNDWEDYDEAEEEDLLDEDTSGEDSHLYSDNSDDSTVILDTDTEADIENHPLFKKEKPKHKWFVLKEVDQRQLGYSAKLQSRELFQRRCYGSLHCVQRLELMYKLEEHAGCVNSLNFHPDGTLLASGADDLKVVIWDWKLGKTLLKYKTKHRANVFQSKFLHLHGDLHIATCARDGQVRLAQVNKEEGVRNARLLGSHKGPCHKLIVLPEQPHIVLSAGEDGAVLNHDVRDPKSTKVVTVREESKTIALYSIHGHPLKSHEFCVSGRDSIVRVYDQRKSNKPAATYTPFAKAKNHRNYHVTCAVYNYNGSEILASYSESDVFLFDVNDTEPGKFIHQYQGHKNGATIKGVNFFGPKSEFVVSGSDCGHIYFWERNSEALVQWLLADDNGVVNCLEPHPQLPFICTSGLDWDVKVWVPSCEVEPKMEGLSDTIKDNLKTKLGHGETEFNENRMLWILWRHLRNTTRLRASNMLNVRDFLQLYSDSNSSGSESVANSDGSDDDLDRPPNCNTS